MAERRKDRKTTFYLKKRIQEDFKAMCSRMDLSMSERVEQLIVADLETNYQKFFGRKWVLRKRGEARTPKRNAPFREGESTTEGDT